MSDSTPCLEALESFAQREIMRQGMGPLKDSVEISVCVGQEQPVTLTKENKVPVILSEVPEKPDLTLHIPEGALETLTKTDVADLGEMGILVVKLLTHSEEDQRIKIQIHIGLLKFVTKGYLGIIPLGGTRLMKHLASKGFGSLGAIKKAIERVRENSR